MFAINIIFILVFAVLYLKTRNYKKGIFESLPKKGNELKSLYPTSCYILAFLANRHVPFSNQKRKNNIERLNIVELQKDSEILFNIRRVALVIMILFCAMAFALFYGLSSDSNVLVTGNKILRPDYGMTELEVEFLANDTKINAKINPREFSSEEVIRNFTEAYEYLIENMAAENVSLEEVKEDIQLPTYLDKWAISINWVISNPEIIAMNGSVNNYYFTEEESAKVTLRAMMSYLDYECTYDIDVVVKAPTLSIKEAFIRDLTRLIANENDKDKTTKSITLPNSIDGKKIVYEESSTNNPAIFLILGIVAAVMIYWGMDKDLNKKMDKRKAQMMVDYSEIVSRLTILSAAGMSIKSAWEKIVKDYEKAVNNKEREQRYSYEEMKITFNEMASGISEGQAYLNFGRRCNIHQYIKLGSLLEQNVKKGTKGLGRLLETEAQDAFEDRKNIAKKMGEEAGTKLLVPMIIMLMIVMVIVMIPAFTSFGV